MIFFPEVEIPMFVRLLKPEDRLQAGLVSHIEFHSRKDDMDDVFKSWGGTEEDEDWGAFTDDGNVMARIINNHMESRLDGNIIKNGGIGAVSTLPEYRENGAVRGYMIEKRLEVFLPVVIQIE